jgi:hypothetical protein
MLGRQRTAIVGNIVAVATEGIHGVNGVALCFGQKEKSIVKILRVLSRDLSTVRICLLCVCVHAVLLVLPPAALGMPSPDGKAPLLPVGRTSHPAQRCIVANLVY